MNRREFFACSAAGAIGLSGASLPNDFALAGIGEYYGAPDFPGVDSFLVGPAADGHRIDIRWLKVLWITRGSDTDIAECCLKVDDGPWQTIAGKVTGERSCEFPVLGGLVCEFGDA